MEFGEYLSVLRKHWIAITLIGLLGFGAGYAYAKSLTPSYTAMASVFLTVPQSETVGERVQGDAYAQNRIESYAELATTPYVLEPVIEELDLDRSPRSLARAVTVTSPLNTTFLEIRVSSSDPERAADIANAVSAELSTAVSQLEGRTGDQPAVRLTVVAAATPPAFPSEPDTRLYAATGLVAGVAIGVLLALSRTVFDTRMRSVKDVRRVTDAPVISSIRGDRRTRKDPVIMRRDPFGDQAEAFRRLRTNLRFVNLEDKRSIMVTSSIPSEGKTTTAINLAIAMAEGSSRILLLDADLRKPSVARYLGLEGGAGLTTVLIGDATLDEVIQPWSPSLDVLASGQIPPNPSELLDSDRMADLLDTLTASYDLVLVDSAPLVPVTDSAALSRFVGGVLLVVGCQRVHRHQLGDALASLRAVGTKVVGLVLNQVSSKEMGTTYVYGSGPTATAKLWARTPFGPAARPDDGGPAVAARTTPAPDVPTPRPDADRPAGDVSAAAGDAGRDGSDRREPGRDEAAPTAHDGLRTDPQGTDLPDVDLRDDVDEADREEDAEVDVDEEVGPDLRESVTLGVRTEDGDGPRAR